MQQRESRKPDLLCTLEAEGFLGSFYQCDRCAGDNDSDFICEGKGIGEAKLQDSGYDGSRDRGETGL